MKLNHFFIIIFLVFNFCVPKTKGPDAVQVGMTKVKVQQILEKPDRVDSIEKRTEIIWGAEEGFWDELPMGTSLEIWIYELDDEELRLYFVDEYDTLSFKIMVPKDAVYESVD